MWAHPETGTVYWHAHPGAGVVDFANVQFEVAGSGANHAVFGVCGGVGFASDDPAAPLWTTYDVYGRSPDVLVVGADGAEAFTLPAATSLVPPRSPSRCIDLPTPRS